MRELPSYTLTRQRKTTGMGQVPLPVLCEGPKADVHFAQLVRVRRNQFGKMVVDEAMEVGRELLRSLVL